jgi:hypothetical protein
MSTFKRSGLSGSVENGSTLHAEGDLGTITFPAVLRLRGFLYADPLQRR